MDDSMATRIMREKEKAQYELENSVARQMPILEQLSQLAEGIDFLTDIIDTQERRLGSILTPESDMATAGDKSPAEVAWSRSELADRLESLNNRLRRNIGRLQEINNRLEL